MNEDSRPIVGISMGDPYGNGPEITVKALSDPGIYERCRPVVIGDSVPMQYALAVAALVSGIRLKLNVIRDVDEALFEFGTIDLISLDIIQNHDYPDIPESAEECRPLGVGVSKAGGEAGFQYVVHLIRLCMEKKVHATVTNAISKEAINLAGHHYSGHTEIYADYTKCPHYSMMLAAGNLRVVHVSTHVSLREACDRVKKERVLECIRLADSACRRMGIRDPKIGVAGLNPHCGENGLFGTEEQEEIRPAIDIALKEGINIPDKAPVPADTVFSKALGGWYDIVVAMYHDQGHIPVKVKGFVYSQERKKWDAVSGVNITLGLPVIRVSVDHGTDFYQAGSGQDSELSLVNAIDYAVQLQKGE